MSITNWWLGEATETTAKVVCRSDATATVTVTCNGTTFTGSADTSVDDGVVAITVTGLEAGKSYSYSIDGVDAGTLKTAKSSGPITIAMGSCWNPNEYNAVMYKLLRDYDLDCFIANGDFPYCNNSVNRWGEYPTSVTSSLAANLVTENYYAHHRQIRRLPGVKELMRNVPFFYIADDHEYPFNDAAKVLADYQAAIDATATQADLDTAWAAARAAISAYSRGNPVNTDPGIDSDALYSRITLGNGLIELFLLDCINYRSSPSAVDDATKTMLGANQKQWLKDRLSASTATYKCLISGKQFWKGGTNSDTWASGGGNYQTELNEILDYINTNNIKGVFAIAGDQHYPSAQYDSTKEMMCVVGCPTGQKLNTSQGTGYPANVVWKYGGYSGTGAAEERVVVLVQANTEYAEISLVSAGKGVLWTGRVYAGSNALSYPETRFAVV